MKNKLLLSFLDSTLKNVEIQDEVQIQEKLLQNIVSTHIEKIFDAYLIWNEITFKQDNSLRLAYKFEIVQIEKETQINLYCLHTMCDGRTIFNIFDNIRKIVLIIC